MIIAFWVAFSGTAIGMPGSESKPDFGHVSHVDMDSIFSAYDSPGHAGCAVGVAHNGEPLFAKGYGTANLDYGIPIRPDSRFMVASVSKQVAAAVLWMMEQEGLLDLDDDLREFLPELPEIAQPVTARQLMHHTSGLRDMYHLLSLADVGLDNTTTVDQALNIIRRQQRYNADPGAEHRYSNTGYFLIAILVKRVTGMSLDAYSRKHFFDPLGMTSTHWHEDTGKVVPDRVISYRPRSFGPGRFYRDNMERVGPRGLFTTIEDFFRWDANFVENRTALDNFSEKMTRAGSAQNRSWLAYASGLRLGEYKTLETVGHGGSYMGFRTHYTRFPQTGLSVMVFCNQSDINPAVHVHQIADLYLRDEFARRFREYPGTFRNDGLNTGFEVVLRDGDLYLQRLPKPDKMSAHDAMEAPDLPGDTGEVRTRQPIKCGLVLERDPGEPESRRLIWQANDRFRTNDWVIRFERSPNRNIRRFTLEAPGTGTITFEKE